ncbi:MAG: hypothetical protein ILM98_06440 [Kiritimatiellae bacterium]|nr:hypothetical protein [Kiritimatiellia bacterium]
MAIVTKKKANVGRCGICAGLSPRTGALALVAVLCVGAAAWWGLARRGSGQGEEDSSSGSPSIAEPVSVERRVPAEPLKSNDGGAIAPQKADAPLENLPNLDEDEGDVSTAEVQSPDAAPQDPPPALIAEARRLYREPGFNGGPVESLLCMMLSASENGGLPPLPMGTEEELRRGLEFALTNAVEIFEDDSPETVEFKRGVEDFKRQLADVVESGGSIREALSEYQEWIAEGEARRREISAEYARLKDEMGEEEANAYLDAENEALLEEGIAPLKKGRWRRVRDRSRRKARDAAILEAARRLQKERETASKEGENAE